jgi:hypothetical protein
MDCRTCKYNSYKTISSSWVSCSHPITIAKAVRWEPGDPAWVNVLTGDIPRSRISELADCPTWEADEETRHSQVAREGAAP